MAIIEIPLTRGQVTIINEEDLHLVESITWRAVRDGRTFYAMGAHGQQMHRIILGLTDPAIECDHRDGNGLNNRRDNLREATRTQNGRNKSKHANSPYRFKGIRYRPVNTHRPWIAVIGYGKPLKSYYLGAYDNDEDAARAYDRAARQAFGEFAKLNFPDETWQ